MSPTTKSSLAKAKKQKNIITTKKYFLRAGSSFYVDYTLSECENTILARKKSYFELKKYKNLVFTKTEFSPILICQINNKEHYLVDFCQYKLFYVLFIVLRYYIQN